MSAPVNFFSRQKMVQMALQTAGSVHYQLTPEELVQAIVKRDEGFLNDTGALAAGTGEFTGHSSGDTFIVKDAITSGNVSWNDINTPLEEKFFHIIQEKMTDYLSQLPELWIRDCYAGADPAFRLNIRVINDNPSSNLLAYKMFLRPTDAELEDFTPGWQILSASGLRLDPAGCGTRQHNATVISFQHKIVLIAGTGDTGEIKETILAVLSYIMPR